MVTIKDIAKKAGVSVSTVSFVINGHAEQMKVSPKTSAKILKIVDELGYKPNHSARRLQASEREKATIALYWPLDQRAVYIGRILNDLRCELAKKDLDYNFVVATYNSNHIEDDIALNSRNYYDYAIIGALSLKDLEYLSKKKIPVHVVLYNRDIEEYNSVCVRYESVLNEAMAFAVKSGCKSIAFAKNSIDFSMSNIHMDYAAKIATEMGMRVIDSIPLNVVDDYEGGIDAIEKLIKQNMLPDMLFCASDLIASGALYELKRINKEKYVKTSIMCFGLSDRKMTQYHMPEVTVIEIPTEKMISGAIDILLSIKGKKDSTVIKKQYEPELHFSKK